MEQKLAESPEGEGCYVYGIARLRRDDGLSDNPEVAGVDSGSPLYVVSCGDIDALVSRVPLSEFGQKALETNIEDLRWLAGKVSAHEAVLEAAADRCPVIPMRFCTIYSGDDRVREMLVEHHDEFAGVLSELQDKREWGIKLFANRGILAEKASEVSESLKHLKTDIAHKSGGAAYFLKKKIEETTASEVERVSDECAETSHARLSAHAARPAANPLRDRDLTGREDDMILNGAYLVENGRLSDFQAELEALKAEYGSLGFSYDMTGPWPAYNFVSIGAREQSDGSGG